MASKRIFHLRKQCHQLQRSSMRRAYTTADSEPPITGQQLHLDPATQTTFLQAQDQKELRNTQTHLETLLSQLHEVEAQIAALPSTVQVLPTIPPYTLGTQRQRIREMPGLAERARGRAAHVRDHLRDLQWEAYGERGDRGREMAAWEEEVAGMGAEEKEERLRSLRLQEEADRVRLERDCEKFVALVKQFGAVRRKMGVGPEEDIRTPNPFTLRAGAAGLKKGEEGEVRSSVAAEATPGEKRERSGRRVHERQAGGKEAEDDVKRASGRPAMDILTHQKKLNKNLISSQKKT